MDNKSRRLSNEDTCTSMYLSFDAESTMSTACYKTMEAMSDMSGISVIEGLEDSVNITNNTQDKHTNSTLEAQDDSSHKSPFKTVKKMEQMTSNTPLRALPKNIMREYKALCSTPSKEQLLKTVDVTRGSDATKCIDLGIAFLGVDDEKPAYFPPPPLVEQCEDNKENALPESEEASTLSASSSVEITTSVIETKISSSMSTAESITQVESVEQIKMDSVDNILDKKESIDTTPKAQKEISAEVIEMKDKSESIKQNVETTPKAKIDNCGNEMHAIDEVWKKPDQLTSKVNEVELDKKNVASKSTGKPKIIILSSRIKRRSVCEPNLQTNKPSRILNTVRKRQSLLPTSRKSTTPMDAETEIPLLMSKMLKISNNSSMQFNKFVSKIEETTKEPKELVAPHEKRRSLISTLKTRTSLVPSALEKRPFSFTHRMSVLVKTTLNSPARKIARRSATGTTLTSMQRRSLMPTKTTTEASKVPSNLLVTRKSLLPKSALPTNIPTTSKPLSSLKETTSNTTSTTQRKSLYTLPKLMEESKLKPPNGFSYNKPDASFTCNVCKEKFRIKSLLDAHKRSHENDNVPPSFVKKPSLASSTTSLSSGGTSNQCKYCDKKFALVKALHIHLLQNCSKIPPADKRKLQYTDLNHVEKAQLPNVFTHHNLYSSASTAATPRNVLKSKATIMNLQKKSLESLSKKNNDEQKTTKDIINAEGYNMAPPHGSVQKIKKSSAHAGVYRTPSKSVPCHLCKLTFKSILDYTNHSLRAHGSSKSQHNSEKGNEVVNENENTHYCKQ